MCIANTISVCIQRFPYTMSEIKNTFLNKNICVKLFESIIKQSGSHL